MEDENGLELSLGLGCGGSSSKSKGKVGSFSDGRSEEVERSNKVINDFKNFLHATAKRQDSDTVLQSNELTKPPENLFHDLPRSNVHVDVSINLFSSGNRSVENEDEKSEASNKRKMIFDERDAPHANLPFKKASIISITTDDGSTAENEDVAESEVEGSTSRLSSHQDDGSKQFNAFLGPSKVPKDAHGFLDVGQKRHAGSVENDYKPENFTFGIPFSGQPINIASIPYSFTVKDSNGAHTPSTSSHPLMGITQASPTATGEQQVAAQSASPGTLPFMFGYSTVQLPTLDKDNSRGLISNPQQFHPSYAGKDQPNSGPIVLGQNSTGATVESAEGDVKHHTTVEGFSSQTEDDAKGSSANLRDKASSEQAAAEGLSLDFSAIRPGIAADLKFGGCGSYPNLPWVSTTAPGPNGRTVSGVTYRYGARQIRIVCACHGSHMTPEEFIRHASDENGNLNSGSGTASPLNTNHTTSAQS